TRAVTRQRPDVVPMRVASFTMDTVYRNDSHYKIHSDCPRHSGAQGQTVLPHLPGLGHIFGAGTVANAWNLEDRRQPLQFRVAEEGGESLRPDGPVPDILVTILVGTEGHLRVVQVQAAQTS